MRLIPAILISLSLYGCTATDHYADRVLAYNEQTDAVSNSMLLLNILRAKDSMPTQFVDVSTITGTNTATAGGSLNLSAQISGSASASANYGSSFIVPVLNSKEFYQGLLTPIDLQTADYFYQSTRPLELVLNLLVDRITVRTQDGSCEGSNHPCQLDLPNDPNNAQRFVLFETMLEYLLANGFTTERFSIEDASRKKGDKDDKADKDDKDDTAKPAVRFCFRPGDDKAEKNIVDERIRCKDRSIPISRAETRRLGSSVEIRFSHALKETMDSLTNENARRDTPGDETQTEYLHKEIGDLDSKPVEIALRLRSTAAIFDYLGRVLLAQGRHKLDPVLIRASSPDHESSYKPCGFSRDQEDACLPLFVAGPATPDAAFKVEYDGQVYAVAKRPTGGFSTATLALLKQILGLNVSAKSAPTPVILTGTPTL